jgi:hypothetical protein
MEQAAGDSPQVGGAGKGSGRSLAGRGLSSGREMLETMKVHNGFFFGRMTRYVMALVIPWALMGPVLAQGGSDAYLEALEQEAGSIKHLDNAAPLDRSGGSRSEAVMERRYVTPGLTRDEFEQELNQRFAGTSIIFQSLSKEAKAAVYREYQNDNRISVIRKKAAFSM